MLAVAMLSSFLPAQANTITIDGIVIGEDGNPEPDVTIVIQVDSSGTSAFSYSNTLLTDAAGLFTDTIELSAGLTQGTLFVRMLNCDDTYETVTLGWHPDEVLSVAFLYCANTLSCSAEITPTPAGPLVIDADGQEPFAYIWNTGETGNSIVPAGPGLYCVTVTDAAGCQASDCYTYTIEEDSLCSVVINLVETGDAFTTVQAVGSGEAPFAYQWSNGESTATVTVTEGQTLCVTVTDATGCSAETCEYVEVVSLTFSEISGFVYLPDSNNLALLSGWAYLYQTTSTGPMTAVDTVPLQNVQNATWYDFGQVSSGEYLVLVELSESSPGYGDYLPTYHFNSIWWDEANIIIAPYVAIGFISFDVVLMPAGGDDGPGVISGGVNNGDNFRPVGDVEKDGREPVAGVEIILLDVFNNPVAYTRTDSNGEFRFEGLAWGTYHVYAEVPGHDQPFFTITIGPETPEASGLEFIMDGSGLTTGTEELLKGEGLRLFPIPVHDRLFVQMAEPGGEEWSWEVRDLHGRYLLGGRTALFGGQATLPMEGLQPGMYTLVFRSAQGLIARKISVH